jgi:hypothetical protein
MQQRHASGCTIAAYRDCLRLLLADVGHPAIMKSLVTTGRDELKIVGPLLKAIGFCLTDRHKIVYSFFIMLRCCLSFIKV